MFSSVCLLEELQNSLLRLVGLRQGCHAGLLQNVVLRHLRDRGADVGVLNAVLRAGQVRYLGVLHVQSADNWLTAAPMVPRVAETVSIAAVIAASSVCGVSSGCQVARQF